MLYAFEKSLEVYLKNISKKHLIYRLLQFNNETANCIRKTQKMFGHYKSLVLLPEQFFINDVEIDELSRKYRRAYHVTFMLSNSCFVSTITELKYTSLYFNFRYYNRYKSIFNLPSFDIHPCHLVCLSPNGDHKRALHQCIPWTMHEYYDVNILTSYDPNHHYNAYFLDKSDAEAYVCEVIDKQKHNLGEIN